VRSARGSGMLDEAAGFLKQVQAREQKKMEEQIARLGIDWIAGSAKGARGEAAFRLVGEGVDGEGRARADAPVRMALTVRNTGTAPFYRLRAESASKHGLFDRREFLFGRLDPGASRTWEVPIKVPRGVHTRTDDLRFTFACDGGEAPQPLQTTLSTVALEPPAFGFSLRVLDPEGNGDGLIQPGEKVDLELTVYNLGAGKAFDSKALLKNDAGRDLFLEAGRGRVVVKEIPAGGSRTESFGFRVPVDTQRTELPIELSIWDGALGTTQVADVTLPVFSARGPALEKRSETLEVKRARAEVRGGADVRAPVVAWAKKGALLPVDRKAGPWYRIQDKGAGVGAGWIHQESVGRSARIAAVPGPGALQPHCQNTPPVIVLEPVARYLKEGVTITLKGHVVDDDADLRDVAVWVGNEKLSLESGAGAANPRNLGLELQVPLDPGPNFVSIIAREGSKFASQKTVVITRPGGLDWKRQEEFPGDVEEDPSLFME